MISEPVCAAKGCKHYLGVDQPDGTEQTERVICKAFPEGIPYEISSGKNKHLTQFPGQKGNFVFEKEE